MSIFQSLMGKKNTGLLGVDISSSAVKLLELERKGNGYSVETYAVEPLPASAMGDKQAADPEVLGEAIARAVSRSGTRLRHAAVAVSGASVITKVIQMPDTLREYDLEEQIKVEADQYIPYPIDEVSLDFTVLGPNAKISGTNDILLAACRREQVEQRCTALELGGLIPKVVDIESYALENACELLRHQMPDGGVNRTVAIVDIGANITSMLVLHNFESVYTRDQSFGGRQLTEDIMRHYGMTFEEAGKAKRYGDLPEDYESDVLANFMSDMAQQIERSLQFFYSASSSMNRVDQLILAGGCAHIARIDQFVQERVEIPTVIAQPFATMSVAAKAKPQALAKDEASLLIACGLALRAFDGK